VSEVNDEDEDDEEGSAEVRAGASFSTVCLVSFLVLHLSNLEFILELVQEDDDDE